MIITKELHDKVTNKINECTVKILGKENSLVIPVTYRTDMHVVAGTAWLGEKRIEFNTQLLLSNEEDFFAQTIPHEVAHILQIILYPHAKQSHGPEWRRIMIRLGCHPHRTHNYDVSVCSTMKRFNYSCSCKKALMLTQIIHNKIQKGQNRSCSKCKSIVVYNLPE